MTYYKKPENFFLSLPPCRSPSPSSDNFNAMSITYKMYIKRNSVASDYSVNIST